MASIALLVIICFSITEVSSGCFPCLPWSVIRRMNKVSPSNPANISFSSVLHQEPDSEPDDNTKWFSLCKDHIRDHQRALQQFSVLTLSFNIAQRYWCRYSFFLIDLLSVTHCIFQNKLHCSLFTVVLGRRCHESKGSVIVHAPRCY